jgi:AcrR family transcriptional regulator
MVSPDQNRALRVDAERNRDAILSAARAVFAERGTNAPLEEIARRADVGIATLYRRFRTREDLLAAAFEPKLCAYAAASRAACAEPDPWIGFCGFVWAVCEMQASDAAFADVVALTFPATDGLDRRLRQATSGLDDVIARAKATGDLRSDFVRQDLIVLLMANAGVLNATHGHAPQAWRRFAAYMLDAFAAPGRSPLPVPINRSRLTLAARRQAQEGGSV